MRRTIGIDLGTCNAVMAAMQGNRPAVIPTAEGSPVCPSVVAVNPKTGARLVGEAARRQAIANPENTIYSIKRLIGHKFSDPDVRQACKVLPYKIVEKGKGDAWVVMGGKSYSPPEISAMILAKLKADAAAYLGEDVTSAVITVPAYFDYSQRLATMEAGRIAGLEVLRIINEPTAAALAYVLHDTSERKLAVCHFGGGTFDISILGTDGRVFEVESTNGNTHLGGDDLDQRITNWLADGFLQETNVDLRRDHVAFERLKEAAEKAKIDLSTTLQSEINLPFITADASGPKHLMMTLTRAKLEQLVGDLVESIMLPIRQALQDARRRPADIDEVLWMGGQMRMPMVQNRVVAYFGHTPHRAVNLDEEVALGAAIQAGVLEGEVKNVVLLDVTPLTLGIETSGGVVTPLIARNTMIPITKSHVFSTTSDRQTQVEIHVVQGERPMAADNKTLCKFILDGIPPAPRGVPQIEVTFDVDSNGILHVSAKDKATGREQKITITASSGLNKEEVERMVKEAGQNAAQDKAREIERRNQADNLAYSAEKTLRDLGEKVPAETKADIEDKIKKLRDAIQKNDAAGVQRQGQELTQALEKLGSSMYGQPGGGTPPPPGGSQGQKPDDDSTDEGEFKF